MVEGIVQGGVVKVVVNVNWEIIDIQIDCEKLDWEDVGMVQDLVFDVINKVLFVVVVKEAEVIQEMVKNMLFFGMGNLGNLFGQFKILNWYFCQILDEK